MDKSELDSFSANNYITSATYLRFYIDRLLHYSDIPYWIYLDCDIVINGNITLPFEYLDFSRHTIAAVLDPYVTRIGRPYKDKDYFNAGVLYFNMDKYQLGISSFSKELITLHIQLKESLIYGDQDILNYYFKEQWIPLDKRYNFQLDHMISFDSLDTSPNIFHFTGPHKPLDNIFSENVCVNAVISLFRLYASISWQDIYSLPLGTIRANWINQER
ncbi:TPA: glycosyltransferase [Haemophilus influenzae]|uniref:glycosyltransferase n=1 Tax=Haemophilus influenzae TaxID=727 RepID=UPI000D01EA1A|nr:glycosyltransferase [Haemophilus influenzae]AXP37805.1 biotin--protein ligase [Haemophilus influenzae]AXP41412.1 biotin--protein ligase [Haemophilus influenzae]AXP56094.1 biotin--protein ligase [Haemophilus influenzae]AXP57743.1 biotin--protein ligase [Haemophilus influenzae]AXP66349.1 biotin--protein ligase [Haemophilus influenzae]